MNLRTAPAKEDEIRYKLAQSARYVSALWSNVWGIHNEESESNDGISSAGRTELTV